MLDCYLCACHSYQYMMSSAACYCYICARMLPMCLRACAFSQLVFCTAEFTDALCPTQWVVADGKLTLKGEIEAASKAEKLEWKPQEEQIDAFGNVVKIKVNAIAVALSVCQAEALFLF